MYLVSETQELISQRPAYEAVDSLSPSHSAMFNDLLAIIAAPKAFGAPLYLLIPTVALGIVYIVLVIRFCMHMRGLKVTWNGTKKKMVLVLGPKNAGKTMLFHALREGRGVETVSSMKELEATFAIHPALNPSKFDAKLNIVDFPGHERLRSYVALATAAVECYILTLLLVQARGGFLPCDWLHRVHGRLGRLGHAAQGCRVR